MNRLIPKTLTYKQSIGVHSNTKYHDPGGGSLDIDIDHAGLHAGFSNDGLHLPGDVVKAVAGWGGYVDGLLHCHYRYLRH